MKQQKNIVRSLSEWLKTSVISGMICALLCAVVLVQFKYGLGGAMFVWLICIGVHFTALIVVGIPFFLMFFPRDGSRVFLMRYGLPVGALLGYFGMWLIMFFTYMLHSPSRFPNPFDSDLALGLLIGAGYGFVTAAVACGVRKSYCMQYPSAAIRD
jgi:hypothetical protein